jgi:hypothetical protein
MPNAYMFIYFVMHCIACLKAALNADEDGQAGTMRVCQNYSQNSIVLTIKTGVSSFYSADDVQSVVPVLHMCMWVSWTVWVRLQLCTPV